MKRIWFYIICIFILFPTVVFASGIELEFIEPSYDVNQTTYIQDPEKPLVFNFTFTPDSKDMKYRIKLTNTEQKALYITEIDHTTNDNVEISYDGIKETDVLEPGESKYANIRFEMKTFPTTSYSDEINFYFKYDLAENHISDQDDPSNPNRQRNSSRIDENPETGLFDFIIIIIPFIIVLTTLYFLINKKNNLFKYFTVLFIPIAAGLIITNVNADKTEGTVVISGNVTFDESVGGGSDSQQHSTPDPYDDDPDEPSNPNDPDNPITPILPEGVYTVEIDPNGGTFRGSPNVYKANYRKGSVIDLTEIDRLYYKFTKWSYGDDSFYQGDRITVNGNIKLKANWEYGPYYNVTIDPNGGLYNLAAEVYKTKIKEGEVLEVHDSHRPGDNVVFYGWEEISNTNSFKDGKITMGRRDVYLKARWEGIYNLRFDLNADDARCDTLSKEVTNMYPIGLLPTPERDGYIFDGWTINNKPIDATTTFTANKDSVAVAHWLARNDVVYTVNHYQQKPGSNADVRTLENYDLIKTEIFKGVTDSEVTPEVQTITGYEKPEVQKTTILGNGKRVINYYYYVRRYDINVVFPEKGIKEVKYKINGSTEYKSINHSDTLKVEFNTTYRIYAVSADGYYHFSTSESNPFTGTMGEATITFAPTVEKCPKGYSCSPGSNEPEKCPAGTYATEGSGTCTSCPGGTHASNAGSDSCETCPAGTKCSGGTKDPEVCPAGTYAEKAGSSKCVSCSEGTYASLPGSTSCTICPKGSKCSSVNPTDPSDPTKPDEPGPVGPEKCPKGTYAGEGSDKCTACPGGTHASNVGSDHCDTCPVGTECGGGTGDPKPCSPGTYAENPGTTTCIKCSGGTYTSTTGSTSCTTCPEGNKCEPGSDKPTKCPAGTFSTAGSSECTKCARNTYSEAGATSCLPCDTGWESDEGSAACRRKNFNVSFTPYDTNARIYATVRDNPLGVPYGSYNTTIITPTYGYYISDIVCTNSFTSDYDSSYLNNNSSVNYSTVRIYNPGKEMGSTCTYYVTRITASMVTYNSVYSTCTDTQCALDDLYNKMRGLGL